VFAWSNVCTSTNKKATMSQWKHDGPGGDIADRMFDAATGGLLGTTECVRDTETGEYREVHVGHGQEVGDAIAKEQFVDSN